MVVAFTKACAIAASPIPDPGKGRALQGHSFGEPQICHKR